MICLQTVEKYCKEYWLIENYQEAVNDTEQMWDCHHIHEIDWALPREELIAIGRYYDVHYSELIFLTHAEHTRLHMKGENNPNYGKEGYWKGKVGPNKGKVGPNKGKQFTEEWKQKISDAHKGKHHTEEWKQKITKFYISVEELHDLYIVQRLTLQQIADLYGCDHTTIWHKIKKYNIKKWK